MSSGVLVEFPQKDVKALSAAMEKGAKYLNWDNKKALQSAVLYVTKSLAASTKVSEKYRKFRDTGRTSRTGANRVFEVWTRYSTPKRRGKVLKRSWYGAPFHWQTIYAKNAAALKRRPALNIAMRGLARQSWHAAAASMRRNIGGSGGLTGRDVPSVARKYGIMGWHLAGNDQWAEIRNKLPYIEQALSGGPQDVVTAMARAARAMEHSIEKQLVKRMGLGKLS